MTDRDGIAIMTAILMTAINYDDDETMMLNDPRERMLDAMFMAEMIWNEAAIRAATRQDSLGPLNRPA